MTTSHGLTLRLLVPDDFMSFTSKYILHLLDDNFEVLGPIFMIPIQFANVLRAEF